MNQPTIDILWDQPNLNLKKINQLDLLEDLNHPPQ